ncbi:hypothetical protein [Streptomyces clavuligerus]|uniref:hypothetical protein n=1 Tax=Streptomyces clavuligerus TaxID=1901 RepID=UPI001E496A93|nr:hypothetical protein [Streptomyces clavuligerus]
MERLEFLAAGDLAGILRQVVAWAAEYDIRGVFASSETFVEPGARPPTSSGSPVSGPGRRVCRNKHLQRL